LEKLKQKYETEIDKYKQEALDWKNAAINKDDTILEKDKEIERVIQERDDWKKEAHRNRRIEQENKQTKEANDVKSEFIKLQQAKRGWKWDEAKGWLTK
jgi:hypothetical protein